MKYVGRGGDREGIGGSFELRGTVKRKRKRGRGRNLNKPVWKRDKYEGTETCLYKSQGGGEFLCHNPMAPKIHKKTSGTFFVIFIYNFVEKKQVRSRITSTKRLKSKKVYQAKEVEYGFYKLKNPLNIKSNAEKMDFSPNTG